MIKEWGDLSLTERAVRRDPSGGPFIVAHAIDGREIKVTFTDFGLTLDKKEFRSLFKMGDDMLISETSVDEIHNLAIDTVQVRQRNDQRELSAWFRGRGIMAYEIVGYAPPIWLDEV